MDIYNYNRITGEFIRKSEARLDPVEQKPMTPGYATDTPPPDVAENEAAIFSNGEWSITADFRWQSFYDGNDKITISELGVSPEPSWETNEPLSLLKIGKKDEIGGFLSIDLSSDIDSDTLGQNNRYSNEDKNTIIALIAGGNGGKLTVNKKSGRSRKPHNDVQVKKLMQDFNLKSEFLYDKYEDKLAEIEAAISQDELDLIVW